MQVGPQVAADLADARGSSTFRLYFERSDNGNVSEDMLSFGGLWPTNGLVYRCHLVIDYTTP